MNSGAPRKDGGEGDIFVQKFKRDLAQAGNRPPPSDSDEKSARMVAFLRARTSCGKNERSKQRAG